MIDPQLQLDVEGSEGCKLQGYQDSLGFWTKGWGHLLADQSGPGPDWTQQQADDQLAQDLEAAAVFAATLPEWGALDTSCRQNAVIELCFNMRNKWKLFVKCRAAIQAKDWQGAHDNLLNSLWAAQVHAKRAERLADYLLTGEYPSA
jgi:GH24 family phage-related lysozyme (muramidase)